MSSSFRSARILAVETSCDETAAAIVEDGRVIFSNAVASQIDLHAQFGGVFPEVASRQHIRTIYPIVEAALQQAHLGLNDLDAIAVTRGPGLPGSLVIGLNAAKGLALGSGLPLVGVNHLEGHIYSSWLHWPPTEAGQNGPALKPAPRFPLMVLIVSGGHTELVLMEDHLTYKRLGATLDDAAGEAFDKVARLIGLSYPGGPSIQKAADGGSPRAFNFPRAWLEDSYNFSFSGLKTAVLREVRRLQSLAGKDPVAQEGAAALPVADLAASFQAAVVDVLVGKTLRAAEQMGAAEIVVAGGVSANKALREAFLEQSPVPVNIPPLALYTDNAAMIGAAGYFRFVHGQRAGMEIDVLPNWPLTEV
ncbi:MAG: tRNA (adenosine(37)-N6)-threonylcarbamoyltransferase complex transferase subunit TsaD [Chloroflexota bacterium]